MMSTNPVKFWCLVSTDESSQCGVFGTLSGLPLEAGTEGSIQPALSIEGLSQLVVLHEKGPPVENSLMSWVVDRWGAW